MALELDETTLDHRDNVYTLTGGAPSWAITRDGVTLGHLVIKSPAGEEGEPVYEIRTVEGTPGNLFGTDWEQIVKAHLNDADPAIAAPYSGESGASQ
ncbi:hypothetical protein N1028_09245 [Herbiconiux sp. CPCC 203407]|uniref:Uncharacterized protein n=1 Tax=Herbiconiux oxytropis TaxID=2970915 RepID=A0AA41XHV5_9MICO|nr:hypothetical protein [Herbiconiux oxytropis]MCS5720505.1 hypothetical protein [Herbiconiux oxytropis]MCS5726078.1 hypothetical protein [Herbiconiux oxytropis]